MLKTVLSVIFLSTLNFDLMEPPKKSFKSKIHQVKSDDELGEFVNEKLLVGVADQTELEKDLMEQVDRALDEENADRDAKLLGKILKEQQFDFNLFEFI
jgi:hypothetical protein